MNKYFASLFLVSGLILGVLIVMQFKTDKPIESNIPVDEIQARDDLLKDFIDEQSYLQSRIVTLRKQIEESQQSIELQSETTNIALLENLKKGVGLSDLSGTGIKIILNDSPLAYRNDKDVLPIEIIQASDIRDIVNILNATHAEAISLNDQRVISSSAISSVGSTVLVNNAHVAPPFLISAIGDTNSMLHGLENSYLLAELYEKVKKSKVVFEVTANNTVTVPIYNGVLHTYYLNLVE
jgi:uncharacterized protein YlxW (UPF0749 family)